MKPVPLTAPARDGYDITPWIPVLFGPANPPARIGLSPVKALLYAAALVAGCALSVVLSK